MKKNKEIIALLRSLVQKIYSYFTINSLVRFAHSIRLFGEIFIYFFHSFATAGNNFFIFFHRGNNTPLFHRLGGAIKRGCVEIFSFIFPPCYMASKNINIFTGYVVSRKNIDIFTGVANTP